MEFHDLMQLIEQAAASVAAKQAIESTIPPILAPLADELPILKKIPALRIRNVERLVSQLAKRLEYVELDQKRIETDEYGHLAYRILEKGIREHRDIKLRMLASALLHAGSQDCTDTFDTQAAFAEIVDWLEPWHVPILQYLRENHCEESADGRISAFARATFDELLSQNPLFPRNRERAWLKHALFGLNDRNLIRIIGGGGSYTKSSGEGKGWLTDITDRGAIMESAEIGLTQLSIDLLRYLQHAFVEEEREEFALPADSR